MDDYDDPLDLLNDDGDGVIEMCLLEEEENKQKGNNNPKNTGCCIVLLAFGTSTLVTFWGIAQFI